MTQRKPGKVEEALEIQEQLTPKRQPGKVEAEAVPMVEPIREQPTATVEQLEQGFWWRSFIYFMLALAASALAYTGLSLWRLWQEHWLLASGLTLLFLLAFFYLLRAAWSEYQASRRLDELEQRRQLLVSAKANDDQQQFMQAIAPLLEQLKQRNPEAYSQYRELLPSRESVAAKLQLAENTWLGQQDKQVDSLIQQETMVVAAAVAIIPHPVFDGLLVLWRSQRLIRRIASIYGLQPTGFSSWRMLRLVLFNTLVAASVETASELMAEQLGYGVVESATGKGVVQGAVMMQRMRRLGQQARLVCRPWS